MMYTHKLFKCPACGYEYQENFDDTFWEVIKGDEEFIVLKVLNIKFFNSGEDAEVLIYICPKCKNLRGE